MRVPFLLQAGQPLDEEIGERREAFFGRRRIENHADQARPDIVLDDQDWLTGGHNRVLRMRSNAAASSGAAPRGREILPRINKIAEVCRKRGALVIHTVHVVRPDGSNTGVMGVIIPAIAAGLINKGNKQAELHPEIMVGKHDIVLEHAPEQPLPNLA